MLREAGLRSTDVADIKPRVSRDDGRARETLHPAVPWWPAGAGAIIPAHVGCYGGTRHRPHRSADCAPLIRSKSDLSRAVRTTTKTIENIDIGGALRMNPCRARKTMHLWALFVDPEDYAGVLAEDGSNTRATTLAFPPKRPRPSRVCRRTGGL